jgi:hypothetical protein
VHIAQDPERGIRAQAWSPNYSGGAQEGLAPVDGWLWLDTHVGKTVGEALYPDSTDMFDAIGLELDAGRLTGRARLIGWRTSYGSHLLRSVDIEGRGVLRPDTEPPSLALAAPAHRVERLPWDPIELVSDEPLAATAFDAALLAYVGADGVEHPVSTTTTSYDPSDDAVVLGTKGHVGYAETWPTAGEANALRVALGSPLVDYAGNALETFEVEAPVLTVPIEPRTPGVFPLASVTLWGDAAQRADALCELGTCIELRPVPSMAECGSEPIGGALRIDAGGTTTLRLRTRFLFEDEETRRHFIENSGGADLTIELAVPGSPPIAYEVAHELPAPEDDLPPAPDDDALAFASAPRITEIPLPQGFTELGLDFYVSAFPYPDATPIDPVCYEDDYARSALIIDAIELE